MIYAILSDIHANLEALQAILKDMQHVHIDRVIFLGDLIGYNPNPNECVEISKSIVYKAIRGNHDRVASGLDSVYNFNRIAREAIRWTQRELLAQNHKYIYSLPAGPMLIDDDFYICHGAPYDEDTYLLFNQDFRNAFAFLKKKQPIKNLLFFGHTHAQNIIIRGKQEFDLKNTKKINLLESNQYLVNPGSVGQPRDRDKRAAYCIYDSGEKSIQLKRIKYALKLTQNKILKAGLDELLALRLGMGK